MDVVVEELWRRTVARTPIIRPAKGFETIDFDVKASPVGKREKTMSYLTLICVNKTY